MQFEYHVEKQMTRLCVRHSLSRVVLKFTITDEESGPVLLFG